MKCIAIEKGKKKILISVCQGSAYAKREDALLKGCDKFIVEAGYDKVDLTEEAAADLTVALETYKEQGYQLYRYVEMDMLLSGYRVPDMEIPVGVSFGFYEGTLDALHKAVAAVEDDWVQYFDGRSKYYCGFVDGEIASFCIVGYDEDCVISEEKVRIGSVGCVGTVPKYRKKGIGLYMVAMATEELKKAGCDKGFIHYTALENWYAKLGYQSFMSFYM